MMPGQLCTELYILQTGSLQVYLPQEDMEESRHGNSRHTGRGGTPLKSSRMRFRVVEKLGHIVGFAEVFQQPAIYPFRVTALKTSQCLYIHLHDMADVLSVFHGADADHVCQVLRSDFSMNWETLKPRDTSPNGRRTGSVGEGMPRNPLFPGSGTDEAASRRRELTELRDKLTSFEERLDGCINGLSTVQDQTSLLPSMHAALRALVRAHSGADS